jgi:hypothetical protein
VPQSTEPTPTVGQKTGTGGPDPTSNAMAAAMQSTAPPTQAAQPTKPRYRIAGTSEERQQKEDEQQAGNVITQMLADPKHKMSPGELLALLVKLQHGKLTGADIEASGAGPEVPVYGINDDSGTASRIASIPSNAHTINIPHSPREQRQHNWVAIPGGTNKDGSQAFVDTYADTAPTGIAPKPSGNANADKLGIPTPLVEKIYEANIMLSRPDADNTAIGAMKVALHSAISNAPGATPKAKHLGLLYVDNPEEYKRQVAVTPLTPQDANALASIKGMVQGTAWGTVKPQQ